MKLPDLNVLIYAYRRDTKLHEAARSWLSATTSSDNRFAISTLSLAGVVRIMTNRHIYPNPTLPADAITYCDSLLSQPNCQVIEAGQNHWEIFKRLCLDTNTRGPDTTDAWYAALAIEWGCEWVTFDRDFLKFPGLNCTLLTPPSA